MKFEHVNLEKAQALLSAIGNTPLVEINLVREVAPDVRRYGRVIRRHYYSMIGEGWQDGGRG